MVKVSGGALAGAFVVLIRRIELTEVIPLPEQDHCAPSEDRAVSQRKVPELMSVIFLLITASTLVASVFLAAFIKAVRSGQFDDDRSPAVRILNDTAPALEQKHVNTTAANEQP